jgi:ABC-type transporter lipoprotein component MlaA
MSTYEKTYAKILQWKREHPEAVSSSNAKYYAANSERIKQRSREKYQLQRQQYLERRAAKEIVTNN